ncbi:g3949 [Coccomyxa elongata]
MDSKMMLLAGLYFGILAVEGQLIGSNSRLSGVLPPPSCVTKGQTLRRGACAAFVDYFVGNSQCSLSGQAFINVVNGSPQPSSQCCSDALDFISNSCSCNQAVINSADIIDWDQGSINCVARATLVSKCNPSGSQSNPCGS